MVPVGACLSTHDPVTGVITVTDGIERAVVFTLETGREVGAVFGWHENNPAEVELWFVDAGVAWCFARDVLQLARFEDADPGGGDVAGWVDPEHPDRLWLRLSNQTDRIVLWCDLDDVTEFVDDTTDTVRPCFDPAACLGCPECCTISREVDHLFFRLGVR